MLGSKGKEEKPKRNEGGSRPRGERRRGRKRKEKGEVGGRSRGRRERGEGKERKERKEKKGGEIIFLTLESVLIFCGLNRTVIHVAI
jgi:hypothetical protein